MKKQLTRCPLPAVTMSSISDCSRYVQLHNSDGVKELTQEDEFQPLHRKNLTVTIMRKILSMNTQLSKLFKAVECEINKFKTVIQFSQHNIISLQQQQLLLIMHY